MPYNVQQPSYPAYSHAPSHGARCAVRRVRYAVLGARRVVRGTRKLPFPATMDYNLRWPRRATFAYRAPRTAYRAPRTAHRAPHTAHRVPRTAHRLKGRGSRQDLTIVYLRLASAACERRDGDGKRNKDKVNGIESTTILLRESTL